STENVAALPGHEWTEWHRKQERNKERRESQIEKWRTDGNFITGHGLERQRIKCANKNGEARSCQEEVVENESGLARNRSEQAALLERRRAPGKERQTTSDEKHQDRQNEHAAGRVVGKSVHGGEHSRPHQEGAYRGKRDRADRKHQGPYFKCIALSHPHCRRQECRPPQPRHQRRVLHRIPEPKTAPAELVVGPV